VTRALRRTIAIVLLASIATGCSKTVNVPLDQVESVQDRKARHHIHMSNGDEYAVRRFTVTDSTIVVDDLSPTDVRFETIDLPIVLRRSDVTAIERAEGRGQVFFIAVPATFVVVAVIWAVSTR
jgi:hypothetical protein